MTSPLEATSQNDVASVTAVVLNYGTPHETLRAVESIQNSDYPSDRLTIIVVDNPAAAGSVEDLRRIIPEGVAIKAMSYNTGYGGGNNAVLSELETDYAFVLNSDALVTEPTSLTAMAKRLDSDPRIAAVAPKILFAQERLQIRLEMEPTYLYLSDFADTRVVGVALFGIRVNGEAVPWDDIGFHAGFSENERVERRRFRWTGSAALLSIPVRSGAVSVDIDLVLPNDSEPKTVALTIGDQASKHVVPRNKQSFAATRVPHRISASVMEPRTTRLVNNAGSCLVDGLHGCDIGFGIEDSGQFDDSRSVFAFCGAAVMLRRSSLENVGVFDASFFLYYEDTDLSWRMQSAGLDIVYEPLAVVDHELSVSTGGQGSPLFEFYVMRNRLLMIAKNASPRTVTRALGGHILSTIRQLRVAHLPFGREAIALRSKVLASVVRNLPRIFHDRWRSP